MNRLFQITAIMLGGACPLGVLAGGQAPPLPRGPNPRIAHWPADRVELRDGRRYEGLIESEDDAWVHLIQVRRPPGQPMHLVIRPIDRASVTAVVRLGAEERAKLRRRIEDFLNRARIEAARMKAIPLTSVTRDANHFQHYRGKWFTLDSTADETTTRRVIVQIEQVFTAYRQILRPRTQSARPLRVVVLGSMEEYRAYLKRLEVQVDSRACFIRDDNLVVAGSELDRFSAQLARLAARHEQLRTELEQLNKQLFTRLAKVGRRLQQEGLPREQIAHLLRAEKLRIQQEIQNKQTELNRCDQQNARKFDEVARQMFARLYHEAFHAYLENYVYPHKTYDVPLWLNEGLAMVCEEGQLESDVLRLDAPHRPALKRLKADLNSGQPLPLEELLAAGQRAFVAGPDADRYYAYAWGLAYYLTFQRRVLGSPALAQYVLPPAENTSPTRRFEKLVEMPAMEFEETWRGYIRGLR